MNFQIPILKERVKFSDLTSFTRQFAAMSEARISLVRILDILSMQTENAALKNFCHPVLFVIPALSRDPHPVIPHWLRNPGFSLDSRFRGNDIFFFTLIIHII